MMKKRITAILLLLVMCAALGASTFALVPHRGYTYDNMGNPTAAPIPYAFDQEVNGTNYGIGAFDQPTDLFVDSENNIYLLDNKNGRIIIFNSDLELVRIIGAANENVIGSQITYNGEDVFFKDAYSLYVYEYFGKKLLYVADTGNSRIIRFDVLGELEVKDSIEAACQPIEVETCYNEPACDIVDPGSSYNPQKLIVDRAERIHVIWKHQPRGVAKLNPDGTFNCFYAPPEVSIPLYQQFWRLISSNEQLDQMEKAISTEYSNIDIDSDGFVWVVIRSHNDMDIKDSMYTDYDDVDGRKAVAPVKKINSYGTDITSRTGAFPPVGDISSLAIGYGTDGSGVNLMNQLRALVGVSAFEDIAVDEYGCYAIADSTRNKVFMYDGDGNLLFQFGNDGNQFGTFKEPVAIDHFLDDKIVVLDKTDKSIMIFAPTDYGETILNAVRAYQTGEYVESEALWSKVLKMNSNNMLAYSGVGKSLYRSGEYKAAMDHFTISKNVEYYSKALEEHLNALIGDKFTLIFLAVIIIVVVLWVIKLIKQFRAFLRNGVKKVM